MVMCIIVEEGFLESFFYVDVPARLWKILTVTTIPIFDSFFSHKHSSAIRITLFSMFNFQMAKSNGLLLKGTIFSTALNNKWNNYKFMLFQICSDFTFWKSCFSQGINKEARRYYYFAIVIVHVCALNMGLFCTHMHLSMFLKYDNWQWKWPDFIKQKVFLGMGIRTWTVNLDLWFFFFFYMP